MDKKARNELYLVQVWHGRSSGTKVFFGRYNRGERSYVPTLTSLRRLEPFLKKVNIHLNPRYVSIYWYP